MEALDDYFGSGYGRKTPYVQLLFSNHPSAPPPPDKGCLYKGVKIVLCFAAILSIGAFSFYLINKSTIDESSGICGYNYTDNNSTIAKKSTSFSGVTTLSGETINTTNK